MHSQASVLCETSSDAVAAAATKIIEKDNSRKRYKQLSSQDTDTFAIDRRHKRDREAERIKLKMHRDRH